MFVGKWFERGLGQWVAPDDHYVPRPGELEQSIFAVVAPKKKNYKKVPPSSAFPASFTCEKCQNSGTPRTGGHTTVNDDLLKEVEQLVLECAKITASKVGEASDGIKNEKKVLEFCTNNTEAKTDKAKDKREKSKIRIMALLENNPELFTETRAYNMNYPPDGFTPLMSAALSDNIIAAQLLLEIGPAVQLQQRDFFGRTAIHIAAEKGSQAVLEFLMPLYTTPPLDLNLRTAYGSALLSPEPSARKLARSLYKPNDLSILGSPQPQRLRITVATPLMAAWADMPGHRITMEDAIVTKALDDGALLAAVCDGHGDGGKVSKFVAEQLQKRVTVDAISPEWWIAACLDIDADLKKTSRLGGSTASIALITQGHIVVANVGDSRCILLQRGVPEEPAETEDNPIPQMAALSLHENMRVISLTQDHKPSLPNEQARIQAAGLSVVEEKYEEDGTVHTLHKVALSKENLLATSRAFGDFEYKTNKDLPADQQAVVAVPDVVVRQRSKDDLYMIVACDGIWDVMSPQQVGDFVLQHMPIEEAKQSKVALVDVADKLLHECLNLGSRDNMSAVVVAFGDASELPPRKMLDFE